MCFYLPLCTLPYPHWHSMASFSIPLCSLWFSLAKCFGIGPFWKEASRIFCCVTNLQAAMVEIHRQVGRVPKKTCKNKRDTRKFVVFGKWVSSLMPSANMRSLIRTSFLKRTHKVAFSHDADQFERKHSVPISPGAAFTAPPPRLTCSHSSRNSPSAHCL